MGHLNLSSSSSTSSSSAKRNPRQWRLLDLVTAALFGIVSLFFLLVFTPLGDSLAASGRQTLVLSSSDPRQRLTVLALVESGQQQQLLEACPADAVDHMPCEDPRRNSQLSRDMNFYRERHCPLPEDTPLCLIPPPHGYQIPVQWPDSLHKVENLERLMPYAICGSGVDSLVQYLLRRYSYADQNEITDKISAVNKIDGGLCSYFQGFVGQRLMVIEHKYSCKLHRYVRIYGSPWSLHLKEVPSANNAA